MTDKPTERDREFHVRTVEGDAFTSGHDTEEGANFSAAGRNARAIAMGLRVRYAVVPKG